MKFSTWRRWLSRWFPNVRSTRGARDRAGAAPGAGLGLAIVQAVSQAHGGQATVENRPEGGARVTIVLRAPA